MLERVPISSLRAFEAAGRTGSFQSAAQELNLTASAVSHAIRKLEDALGTTLFFRSGRNARLNIDGDLLMGYMMHAFEEMRVGMEVVSTRGPQLLRIHSAPSFATQWIAPRLKSFVAEYPNIELRLAASTDYAQFTKDEYDIDIVYGRTNGEGLVNIPLGDEILTPLCTPEIAQSIATKEDLLKHRLIFSDYKQVRWASWFKANSVPSPPAHGIRFDRSFLAIRAAVDGLGVVLEATRLAERELESGALVAPLRGKSANVCYLGHHLVFPSRSKQRLVVKTFVTWILRELGLPSDYF